MKSNRIHAFYDIGPISEIHSFGEGLIHHTYQVQTEDAIYILQQCNAHVFQDLEATTQNIFQIGNHIAGKRCDWSVPHVILNREGNCISQDSNHHFRLFEFLPGRVLDSTFLALGEAYQVAQAFGEFIYQLQDFPANQIFVSIPAFHSPLRRWKDFQDALSNPVIEHSDAALIEDIQALEWVKNEILSNQLPVRIVHSDAKSDNILVGRDGEVKAILDLDTVMPGYLFHDYGDLMRSMVFRRKESEHERGEAIDPDLYQHIRNGFLAGLRDLPLKIEVETLDLGAAYLMYEQCLRFLTDYLQGSIYYKTSYPTENLVKAGLQMEDLKLWINTYLTS